MCGIALGSRRDSASAVQVLRQTVDEAIAAVGVPQQLAAVPDAPAVQRIVAPKAKAPYCCGRCGSWSDHTLQGCECALENLYVMRDMAECVRRAFRVWLARALQCAVSC